MKKYLRPELQVEYLVADTDTSVASCPTGDCVGRTTCVSAGNKGEYVDSDGVNAVCEYGNPFAQISCP